ncbi:cell division protein FtsA [Abditibacteriota bacterium]|nr:cell division protein FtsA [Abditibacteriota bacterium]
MSPSFSSPPVVVGLDIGTTKICALVVGEGDENSSSEGAGGEPTLQILGVGIVPSQGVRRGVVVDVPDTEAAIKEAVARAAHMAGVEIEGVVAGVTGDHILSQNRTGSVTVASRGNQVSAFDVDRALSAALLEIGRDREIIHSVPRSFAVDEQRGIRTPLGMVGTRLEVETHIVTGQSSILRNTLSCLSGAGVRADGLVLEPIATAEAVTTRAEREMGALVLDIGGGTTDLAAYFDGAVVYSAALPVGGNHVTRDVSIGLSTPFEFAEKLKVGSGAATRDMIPHGEALEVLPAGGASKLRIPRALLGEIIEARMRELFELSLSMAMNGGLQGMVPAGIILSGGGALLPGSVELAGRIFGLPVRLGVPQGLSGWSESVASPQFSTAVGLCHFALAQKRVARQRTSSTIALPQTRRVWAQLSPNISMARPLTPPVTPPTPAPVPVQAPVAAPPQRATAREEFPAQMNFSPAPNTIPPPTNTANVPVPIAAPPSESVKPAIVPAPAATNGQEGNAPVPPANNPLPIKDDLAEQRAKLRDLMPRIDATRNDVSRAKQEPSPQEIHEQQQGVSDEKPTFWNRFLKFVGFDDE